MSCMSAKEWLTSDLHLGEDRFAIMNRPFTTADEHNQCLLKLHNAVVGKDDLVHLVGDAVYKNAPQYIPMLKEFNGHKILYVGNHDNGLIKELTPYFDDIVPEGDGRVLEIDGRKYWLTHYPTQGRKDMFNLVGHVHGAWKFQLNMINIGVDANHFRPTPTTAIPGMFTAIEKFYDRDVWVGNEPVNQEFVGKRGAQTRYYNPTPQA